MTPPNPTTPARKEGGELLALAERVKSGAVVDQGNLILIAHDALFPEPESKYRPRETPSFAPEWEAWSKRICAVKTFVQFGAFIDAAMLLLPTDGSMSLLDIEMGFEPNAPEVWPAISMRWYPPHHTGPNWHALVSSAATLPLTIVAAALEVGARALSPARLQEEDNADPS